MTASRKPRPALRGLSWQDVALIGIPAAIAVAFLLWFAREVVRPPPPSNLMMTAGAEGGAYARFAERYRDVLARKGIRLTIKPSAGSIENVARLMDSKSGVDLGFVQSGSISGSAAGNLVSLGSLYYEPLWVFYRGNRTITGLKQLDGLRLAIGAPGSGTFHAVMEMLSAAGMVQSSRSQLKELATPQAAQALQSGAVDAAFFFASAEAPVVRQLLNAQDIKLMSWDRAEAYARRFSYLMVVTLPSGVIDLEHDTPASEIKLLASTAELVARDGLHPALSDLLIEAAQQIHSGAGLIERPGEFPAPRETDIALSDDAQRYYRSGKTFLNRYLPFWAATLVQRALVFLLPIVAVLIPMFKLVPPLYRWRVRSRVYRWYGDLMMLEHEVHSDPDPSSSERHLKRLDWIEDRVNSTWPPLSFAEERYALLAHVRAMRQAIEARK